MAEPFSIDLAGHAALVTGAGQHTGRGFSKALAACGASVLVNDVVEDKAEAVAEEIRHRGQQRRRCQGDHLPHRPLR
jgi:NAD(P)-dependent dehydrogenase (short-subunit alcohol dehydrogenase family)